MAALASGIAGALEVDQDTLVNMGVQLALQLPNSREAEYDADRRGFHKYGAGLDMTPVALSHLHAKAGTAGR